MEPQDSHPPSLFANMKFKEPSELDHIEKPFDIRCEHPEDIPSTNINGIWIQDIPIYDMRSSLPGLSLDVQGFVVTNLTSTLKYEEFFDEQKLKVVFAEELRAHLLNLLGAKCVFFHECVVSISSHEQAF